MRKLAWVPVALTVLLLVSALLLGALEAPDVIAGPWTVPTLVATVAGALIITRRPSHPIGWMFTWFGLLTSGVLCSMHWQPRLNLPRWQGGPMRWRAPSPRSR